MGCGGPGRMAAWIAELRPYAWIAELRSYNRTDCGSLLYATWTAEARRGISHWNGENRKGARPRLCTPLGLFI